MRYQGMYFHFNALVSYLLGNFARVPSLQQNNKKAIIAHKVVLWLKIAFEVLNLTHTVSNLTEIPHTSYFIPILLHVPHNFFPANLGNLS